MFCYQNNTQKTVRKFSSSCAWKKTQVASSKVLHISFFSKNSSFNLPTCKLSWNNTFLYDCLRVCVCVVNYLQTKISGPKVFAHLQTVDINEKKKQKWGNKPANTHTGKNDQRGRRSSIVVPQHRRWLLRECNRNGESLHEASSSTRRANIKQKKKRFSRNNTILMNENRFCLLGCCAVVLCSKFSLRKCSVYSESAFIISALSMAGGESKRWSNLWYFYCIKHNKLTKPAQGAPSPAASQGRVYLRGTQRRAV